ncbi:MAG: GNAT family N-acetyltransferase [Pseudomonadota bacterium]
MMEVEIRIATLDDARTISEISRRAYVPAYEAAIGAIPKPATEDYTSRIQSVCVWLAETDGLAAGVLVIEKFPEYLLIYSVAVDPARQGQGLGAKLLKYAEKIAAREGLRDLRLYTNSRMKRNLSLYNRAGFKEFARRPHPSRPGHVLVDMSKRVDGTSD